MAEQRESPSTIRDRAVAVADYLLAVRAQMDRPARTVPGDAHWLHTLPRHPECQIGPGTDGSSWLRVGRPELPAPVAVPAALRRRLRGEVVAGAEPTAEPNAEPAAKANANPAAKANANPATNPATDPATEPPTEGAGDDFETWRDEVWRPWSLLTAATEQTRELHRRLFDRMHQLDMATATTELVWGHGIVETVIDGARVRYPLVATPVLIEYDADRALVTVSPAGPSRLQVEALAGLDDRHLAQLTALTGPGGAVEVDLWNDVDRRELFERALSRLGFDRAIVDGPENGPKKGAFIRDVAVLFARPRQRHLRGFLESLRDGLTSGDMHRVGALAAVVAHEPSRLLMPDDRPETWERVGERLLMPLPTNEAQESIARRLAHHRNVAVQGPPGTGKTHTIRNLICHLMANGKRVLVVAQKEEPLRVLRDGLPEEVQPLCLAVLGRTTDQLVQLQLAARELSDRAATLDKEAEGRRVDLLTRNLEEAERELAVAMAGLRLIAESEAQTYQIGGVALMPAEVGAWLRERAAAHGGIPDPVSGPPPLTIEEFATLLKLAARLTAEDRAAAMRPLPEISDLPDAASAAAARAKTAETEERMSLLADQGVDMTAVRGERRTGMSDLLADLREAVSWLKRREGTWTDRLGRLLDDPHWRTLWNDQVVHTETLFAELATLAREVTGHRIAIPGPILAEPKLLLSRLAEVRQRFAAGKSLNRLLQPGLFRLADEVRVDGEPLRTVADVDLATAGVRREQARRRLGDAWSEWVDRLQVPEPPGGWGDPEVWAGTLLAEANQSLDFDLNRWPPLARRIAPLMPQRELVVDATGLAGVADACEAAAEVFGLEQARAVEKAVAERVAAWPELAESWRTLDDWDSSIGEVRRLVLLQPDVMRFDAAYHRLVAAAPEWAAMIAGGEHPVLSGQAVLSAWEWRRAQTWFDGVVGEVDPAVLSRRVERARSRIRSLTAELVVASAWLEVSRALDDRRRAALADWATALRKIGKGTGRGAATWQAHAQRAMESAVSAVPVWVMSVDRAIEQFAGGARFDVVIVDEASQADLFSLPVLTLAERAVVVGDDQQIGPQLGFVGPVTGLIRRHLDGVPSAEHFDPESSLYDHAVRRSPERILLTEHFRCVPQIIEFSSRHYYDGRIRPLRADRPSLPPIQTVFCESGERRPLAGYGDVNLEEATALVDRVTKIVADPRYDGRTLGVISLLSSSGQATYLLEQLREAIGEDEIQARRLRVGDAYTFQGDERDVVLISTVVSERDPRIAAFTKRDYHRRINVAASRARDQLWIFHSVRPGALLDDDARGRLLSYAVDLPAEAAAADPAVHCETDFERDVLKLLVGRGYRPIPQFRIGDYRIDFVLNAPDGRRLAIECDGDTYRGPDQWESDMRRQSVLERVGNCVFVRIRGSVFAREPEVAIRPVWQRIGELEITTVDGD
ncbi:very short patch repair endonuclease [Actinoplanes lobatus]|uniref:Very short patch repair endonuclease n=1 Tax=Actinoplanes lobatus TaxID=113568 RepID=A0A7W7HDY0_9ACTN|nr:AAA domain-containing protein [Actinoplanes lobatus]MBB4748783.1 very-short-patch-repair endonuclease [Actinoplanes lobatus]GGN67364.1 very short patch repair endonuclease [Actinoplanes lobatus]GIE37309.1 very short patch repair endonuclease [Actinoplanes lobatus]